MKVEPWQRLTILPKRTAEGITEGPQLVVELVDHASFVAMLRLDSVRHIR